jgi:hypothetical protein
MKITVWARTDNSILKKYKDKYVTWYSGLDYDLFLFLFNNNKELFFIIKELIIQFLSKQQNLLSIIF